MKMVCRFLQLAFLMVFIAPVAYSTNYQCVPTPSHTSEPKNRRLYPTSNESLVYLRLGCPGGCSGVIVGKDLIMTAAHCLSGSPYFFVNYSNNETSLGVVVNVGRWFGDIEDDWMLIQADTGDRKPLKLACSSPNKSDGIDLTCGGKAWPQQQAYPVHFLGIHKDSGTYLKFIGMADHGDSGSAVLNNKGEIVGIVSELDLFDPNIGKAVPLSSLQKALGVVPSCSVIPH